MERKAEEEKKNDKECLIFSPATFYENLYFIRERNNNFEVFFFYPRKETIINCRSKRRKEKTCV